MIVTQFLQRCGFPARVATELNDNPPDTEMEIKVPHSPFMTNFIILRGKMGKGATIALIGNRRTGKTTMATMLAYPVGKRNAGSRPIAYTTAHRFFMEVKDTFGHAATTTQSQVMERFESPVLLVIDELDKRVDSDWENATLFELLNWRHGALKDTILIANIDQDKFSRSVGPSLMARINETGGVVVFDWPAFKKGQVAP